MPYAIQLPDGTLVENIPDDLDPIEAKARISAHFKLSEPVKKNTSGLGDIGTAAKQSLVGTAKSFTDVFGAENEYSEKLGGVQQRLEQEYTPARALERQKREQLQEEAAKSGDLINEITTFLGGVTEAPVQALASGLASIVPYVGTGIIGGVFKLGAPTVAALNSVLGASQGAGSIKGSVYSSVKKELEKGGMDSKEAEDRAIKAQEYLGDNWKNIIAGAGIGAVAGRKGVEELLVPGALARQQANIIPRVATTVLKEAPIEGLQGGQQQFAENVALQQEGFDVPTFQGVAGSAARDAAIGAITAAPLGAIARPPKVDLEATYTNVIDELRNTLGTSETLEPQEVLKQIQKISKLQDPAQIQALYENALNNGDFNTIPMPDNSIRIQIPEANTQQKVKEAVEDSTPDAFTPELRQSIESFKQPIIKQMQRFGLSNVVLKIFDTIENGRADGYYANKVIALAMDSPSPIGTLRHETVHALRELGGFKPNEWNVLSKKAKNEWTDQFIKNVKIGDGTLYDQYQAQYQKDNNGSLDGFDDYITEEAVAEAFRYFDVNGAPSGLIGNLYYRLKQFFETLRNGFTGAGFDTTDKIFTRVEQGKAAPTIKEVAEQPNKYAIKPDLTTKEGVIEDSIRKYSDAVEKHLGDYDTPVGSAEARGLNALYKIQDNIEKRLEAVGVQTKGPSGTPNDSEMQEIFNQIINPQARDRFRERLEAKRAEQPTKYAFKQTPAPEDVPQDIWDLYSKYDRITKMANEKMPSEPNKKGVYPRRQDLKREETLSFRRLNDAIGNYFGQEWDGNPSGPIYDMYTRLSEEMGNRDLAQKEVEEVIPKKYSIKNVPPLQEAFDYARSKDFKTNRELKVDLQSQILKELDRKNINIKEFNKKAIEYLTEIGELDAEYALKSNPNAVGWYDITVAKALNIVALLHPEILTNPDAKFAFTWALAVTSNGIKVDKNFELAEQAYRGYKENGVMPTNIEAGQAQIPINIGLGMFNQMVDKYGIDDMRKFMATEFTVSQLKKITNLDLAGENADTKVLGSFILGAKIGNGFFSNLNGIFDKLTMDRWLMRTWGRWTGTLITERPDKVKEYISINRRNIAGLKTNTELREAVEAITKTNITVDSLEEILKDNESVQNFALKLAKYWSKEDLRNIIDSAPKGEALRLSTNTLSKYVDGQKEKPDSGTERNEIREIFSNILERLNKKGYKDLSMADLQAALWYSERRLYDAAKESNVLENYADDEAPDYANAAAGLVIKNGISQEAVDEVILDTEEQYADRATGIQRDAGEVSTKVSLQGRVQGFVGKELKHFLARGVLQSYRELNEETPDTFKRNSGKDGKGFRVLKHHAKTKFSPELKFANSLKTIGVTTPTFYEMDAEAAPTFQKLIQESKDNNTFGAAVTVYPVEAYEDMRLFFTEDGKAGFALKGNDIVSVFSQDPYVGGVNGIIRLAVQEGGRKLDAFDTVLPDLYFNNGFQVTSRMKWNDDYVPDGWNKETFKDFNNGEPDVVFMAYEPSNNKRPTNQTGKLVDDYDEAVNIQEEVVKVAPKYSLSTRQSSINEQNKRFAFALQNKLTPDTFLTSDRNKDINGNLAFMPQNSPFPKLPIRMAIGIQDDVQNRGSGATHILRRIQQEYDKAHVPEPLTQDLLEDLLRRAENVGESFGFVYRSGNNLVLHDGLSKVSMFVNKQPDHFSINSMYKDPEAFRKYGNPVWRGRNEQPMKNFQKKVTEDFRAVPVVAGERGVELKNKPTAPTVGFKKRRVVSPDEIAKLAPTGAKLAIRTGEFKLSDLPKGDAKETKVFVLKKGTEIYHGAYKERAEKIKESGKSLTVRPEIIASGGAEQEAGLIYFGDKETATDFSKNKADPFAVQRAINQEILREEGEVFSSIVDKDYKFISPDYVLNQKQANTLNTVLGLPDYKKLQKGNTLSQAGFRATEYKDSKIDRYEINGIPRNNSYALSVKALGFDGIYENIGFAITADNGIRLGTEDVPMQRYALRAPNTPAFKRFFGSSKIVNEDGTPKVMYHGTARDISEFRPKQANAIFLTEIPRIAEAFASSSENYMIDEISSYERKERFVKKAQKISKKEGTSFNDELNNLLKNDLPSAQNIMPVFVRAENPFDYENVEDIKNLYNSLTSKKLDDYSKIVNQYSDREKGFLRDLNRGSWTTIENPTVQKYIRGLGYDSFYVVEGGTKNLAVYNPNQIKSATGNIGTFDINTPDIRYSLNRLTTLQTNKTAGQKISQAYDTARNNFGNSQYWIAKRNGWIDPSSGLAKSLQELPIFNLNGELRADMLVRAKSQALNLIKNGLLSGIPVLNPDGTIGIQRSENNFARSMYLADQLDKNATVKASGLSGRGYVAEVARILRGADILKEDARLNAEGLRQLDEAKIAMKEAKDLFKQGKMKEARKKEKEAKKLQKEGIENKKSKRELQVTPAHIKWAEQQLTKVPEMNEILGIWKTVNNGLVDLWEEVGLLSKSKADEYRGKDNYIPLFKSQEDLGDAEFFAFPGGGLKSTKGFKRLKGSTAIRNIWENLDKHYAVMLSHAYENQTRRVAVNQLKTFQLAENLNANDPEANLWYKEDGKKVGARIENLNDLAAFQMMTYELGPIMQFFAGSTQLLRAGALINPMYWIKQLIRDPIHANLVAGSGMITPLHSMRGFVEVLMKNSRESKILTDRGVLGSVDSTTTINQFLEEFGKEKASPTILSKALSKIMSIHEASDAATRVEIYKKAEAKALKEGKTAEQAMSYAVHMARESINFSVHGNSPALNALRHSVPFFSAAINSLDTVYRAATGFGLNAKEKKEAQLMFFQRAVMMTILSTMYAMLYQDDEEYKKLPDYVKDNHWLIPNPMSEKPPFIKIPTPFEIGFFFKTIPEALVRYFAGTSTGKEVLASYGAGLLHNLPANGLPVPQAFKPVAENFINFSFFTGRGIEGMSDQGRPVSERGQRASEFAKILSSYGLDKIGQSPAKIDNLIQGYFAELGTFSAGLASSLLFLAQGKEPPSKNIENMPFMKAFLTDRNVVKAISDFYELDHNAKEVATQFNDLKQSGMTGDIQKLIDDPEKKAQLMASPVFRKVSTQMATIRKAIEYYKDNQDSGSPDFRRDKINELTEILGRVAESGYKIAEATGVSR